VQLHVSERRACAALGQHRSTQRKIPRGREDEERLTADIIELARQYGRYGYRKIAELLRQAGWTINDKRVERIWQREGQSQEWLGAPPPLERSQAPPAFAEHAKRNLRRFARRCPHAWRCLSHMRAR